MSSERAGLDQPLVRPPDEAASGTPGLRPSIASELRARAAATLEAAEMFPWVLAEGLKCAALAICELAEVAERERWTREHDRTA